MLVKLRPGAPLAVAAALTNLRPLYDAPSRAPAFGLASGPAWYVADLPDGAANAGDGARAHVDTGYDRAHAARPRNVLEISYRIMKTIGSETRQAATQQFFRESLEDPFRALLVAPTRGEPFAALHGSAS